ncbi:hypothetical protein GCM10007036_23740 [Alsobacter metallidurans]|uniref:NlpC/P60 domain-containing protein n=1 Tax=Alsobacter metallidurans TaxID=340221 RepID=A0A917MIF3_9HYPH|nr:hypothetical protein [Alsobacter metallidurans]GGH20278.1 hypothetical protein GCM10007036_23740 [Alsobacter metallidurans]
MARGVSLHVLVAMAIAATAAGLASTRSASAQDRVVRAFENGSTFDSVGLLEGGDETEVDGPQALVSDSNGALFLLDQNNGRVLTFDPTKSQADTRSLELPSDMRPSDLVIINENLLVWDDGPRALTTSGDPGERVRSLNVSRAAILDPELAADAFAQMGTGEEDPSVDPLAVTRAAPVQKPRLVATRGSGEVQVVSEPLSKSALRFVVRPRSGGAPLVAAVVRAGDRLGAVDLLEIDAKKRMFLLAENVPEELNRGAAAVVLRYGSDGQLQGMYELPLAQSVALSRRFIAITPDGTVFFLRTKDKGVEVVEVGFKPTAANAVIAVKGAAIVEQRTYKGISAAVRRPTRRQVIETAINYETFRWRVTPASYGRDPDRGCSGFNRIRRPGYINGRLGQEVVGVPYCWGCFGNLSQISSRMVRGDLAGNVCTRDTPRADVVGVDCSAFVSAAWGLSSHFTTLAIPSIASPLSDPWDLKPGDALNKPGSHVMLFLRFTPDRKAEVIEATPGRCNGRVCRGVYPLSAMLARGYVPMRYRGIAAEVAAVEPTKADSPRKPDSRPVRAQKP